MKGTSSLAQTHTTPPSTLNHLIYEVFNCLFMPFPSWLKKEITAKPEACSFLEMDPFHPVSAVLALTPLAPAPLRPDASSVAAFAELELSGLEQTLEQTLELRMAKRDGKDLVWPFSLKVGQSS